VTSDYVTLDKNKIPVRPEFHDVPRVIEESRFGMRETSIAGSHHYSDVSSKYIRRRTPFGVQIDTNVPMVDEKVIDISDQFNHYEWHKQKYHEWHNIPLDSVMESELKTLYSKVIYRSQVRYGGHFDPETNSYRLRGDGTTFLSPSDQKYMSDDIIKYYMKFPLENVEKTIREGLQPLDYNSWTSSGLDVELRVEKTALTRANALRRSTTPSGDRSASRPKINLGSLDIPSFRKKT
jgi:hypothetical protein